MSNWYATRKELASRLGIDTGNTTKNSLMDETLESVSRMIEMHTDRWFYPRKEVRYYTPKSTGEDRSYRWSVLTDDLLSLTELATDQNGTNVYGDIWTLNTDYALEPANAALGAIPSPYWRLDVLPYARYTFPAWQRSVRATGNWGYYDVRQAASATLAAAITTTSATSITLSAAPDVTIGHTIWVDSEAMFVTALAGAVATVQRAQNGTTAATHSNGAAIQIQSYPVVHNAALFQAQLDFTASEGSGLARGGGDTGATVSGGVGLHPWAARTLAQFTRLPIG